MRRSAIGFRSALALLILALSTTPGSAVCAVLATGLTVSPLTASTGSYTPPGSPSAQAISLSISGSYLSALGGTCTVGIAFNRSSLPASMANGGGATLPYVLQTTPSGGTSLLYTGAGAPAASSLLTTSFSATTLGLPGSFSTSVTLYALMVPGSPQAAGSYSDSITANTFDVAVLNLLVTPLTSSGFTVTGSVGKSCTIGGVSTPGADSATIPITASGAVNTSPIVKSYLNAACNTPSNVQLSSQNGGVKTGAAAVSGFTGIIDYLAAATFSGATATLDTSTVPSASGTETGTAAPTSGATPTGTLSATITPKLNTMPLRAGSYADTLTITLTPQ